MLFWLHVLSLGLELRGPGRSGGAFGSGLGFWMFWEHTEERRCESATICYCAADTHAFLQIGL
ncbi:hypothetical protein GCM10009845_38950 [Pedococcus bigeumensis]